MSKVVNKKSLFFTDPWTELHTKKEIKRKTSKQGAWKERLQFKSEGACFLVIPDRWWGVGWVHTHHFTTSGGGL